MVSTERQNQMPEGRVLSSLEGVSGMELTVAELLRSRSAAVAATGRRRRSILRDRPLYDR